MLFQFNTDNFLDGNDGVATQVEAMVRRKLDRVSDRLSRVEFISATLTAPKGGTTSDAQSS